jgi:SAM-dependent methyltransferase
MKKLDFICPDCKIETAIFSKDDGSKFCKQCNTDFPFINNILRLTDITNYSESFGFQWNIFRKTQLDSFVQKPISRERLYEVTKWQSDLEGQSILEAGSGAGRFTEVLLSTKADVYSFDYSNAVEANYMNNGESPNLTLFQGDIYKIPFQDYSFDHVICLGVLQHTPNPKNSFVSLSKKVKPGGYLYIDLYTKSFHHWLQWKYFLRPITKRLPQNFLFTLIKAIVPILLPITQFLKKIFGRFGARLSPIKDYTELELGNNDNKNWAILDTFDMYSPEHDHPQTKKDVEKWFRDLGFSEISVWYGKNGVVGRGKREEINF